MEHFYQNIEGWFSYEHVYRTAVANAANGALLVEIGSFKGRSSAFLIVEAINSGKNLRVDLIDTWKGSTEHQQGGDCEVPEVVNGTLYETFLKNMEPVQGLFNIVKMPSIEAANLYEDNSIDFLMIDGEHMLEAVTADIRAFLPKMKHGGLMCGDDAWVGAPPHDAARNELSAHNLEFKGNHFYATINRELLTV